MKYRLVIILIFSSLGMLAQDVQWETKAFSQTTTVTVTIKSDPTIVWAALTNSENYPSWNSTIVSLNGTIALGEKIEMVSTLDPERTFKLKVAEFVPNERMVWKDNKGKRTFTIEQLETGVEFTMSEKIGGLMYPLYKKHLPDFNENFATFAADLVVECRYK